MEDIFTVLESEKYPLLWREYIKINAIIPTTVNCEQTFSVLKRAMHVNMKAEIAIAKVTNKMHEKAAI